MLQCSALSNVGAEVTLYAKRTVREKENLECQLKKIYGIDPTSMNLKTYYSRISLGDNARIAILALGSILASSMGGAILSRNLHAAYVLGIVMRRPIIFETHQIETGIRRLMQRSLLTAPHIKTVLISGKLVEYLESDLNIRITNPIILHDAAPSGIKPLAKGSRRKVLQEITKLQLNDSNPVCGYFGHLYRGRGIDIIERMARARGNVEFLVYGGNDKELDEHRKTNKQSNLHFMGHAPHPIAQMVMRSVDVLLMPYQRQVSIGTSGHDTARWMSPMKMFEYMATSVPIISSDLPVLREVLRHNQNCLMATPDNARAWIEALDRLINNEALGQLLGEQAHQDYLNHYTWDYRAKALLQEAQEL